MKLEKDFGTAAAAEINEIAEELKSQIKADEETETAGAAFGSYTQETHSEETVSGEYTEEANTSESDFSKEAYKNTEAEDLKQSVRGLFRELGKGAREIIETLRANIPNKTMRMLMKIGVGIAVFSLVNSWLGRIAVAAGVVYLLFGNDMKEHAK